MHLIKINPWLLLFLFLTGCKISKQELPDEMIETLQITYSSPGLVHTLQVEAGTGEAHDPFVCNLIVSNGQKEDWEGIINIILSDSTPGSRFFLPGFLYGTNQGQAPFNPGLIKQFPRLRKGDIAPPYSPFWFMRGDQLTHPVAMMYTGDRLLGISGSPYMVSGDAPGFWSPDKENEDFKSYNGFYCSLGNDPGVGYTVGYQASPGVYRSPWEYIKDPGVDRDMVSIEAGGKLSIPFKIYAFPAEQEAELGMILRSVYMDYHQAPLTGHAAEVAIKDITQAISIDAYGDHSNTYGLISKKPESGTADKVDGGNVKYALNNHVDDDYDPFFEGLIGWTNGTVIASPLLLASYQNDNAHLREQAVEVIEDIVNHSINPRTGIPFCTKIDGSWTNAGWWTEWINSEGIEVGHSSYIIGQALYYILKAYEIEQHYGKVEQTEWLSFVEGVLQGIADTQNPDGAFPRFWSEDDASGSEYDAFSGCWVAATMAYHAKLTKRDAFLKAAIQAELYYERHVRQMECIKTPLDVADAPDSEGILAYIRLVKILHELTGKQEYLSRLQSGLDYSFSYKFCYNAPITSAPLDQLGWSTSGGDITSVCNAVIHCMSNSILEEIQYAYQQTGDAYYKNRLEDTYLWGLQAYNRTANEFFFGKQGWSTEYFCQSNRYVLDIRLTDNSRSNIWFAYHPWATASILEGLLYVNK